MNFLSSYKRPCPNAIKSKTLVFEDVNTDFSKSYHPPFIFFSYDTNRLFSFINERKYMAVFL